MNSRKQYTWGQSLGLIVMGGGSVVLFMFGILTLIFTYWPVFANALEDEEEPYFSQLPLSRERIEAFEEIPVRSLYPALGYDIEDMSEGNWIRIPSIGVAVPLERSASMEDQDVLTTLDLGAALYPNGIDPGHPGRTFISAHSTGQPWKGKYRFAFLKIDEVTTGNYVHLDWEGTRYSYRINSKEIIEPKPDFSLQSAGNAPTLTFMACWPLWTTAQRMLVSGELTNISRL